MSGHVKRARRTLLGRRYHDCTCGRWDTRNWVWVGDVDSSFVDHLHLEGVLRYPDDLAAAREAEEQWQDELRFKISTMPAMRITDRTVTHPGYRPRFRFLGRDSEGNYHWSSLEDEVLRGGEYVICAPVDVFWASAGHPAPVPAVPYHAA